MFTVILYDHDDDRVVDEEEAATLRDAQKLAAKWSMRLLRNQSVRINSDFIT